MKLQLKAYFLPELSRGQTFNPLNKNTVIYIPFRLLDVNCDETLLNLIVSFITVLIKDKTRPI